jgi:glutamate carboxypeptidase
VRRKAAGSVRVAAHGRAAHAGSAPDKGLNALLALADAATRVAGLHDPDGPHRFTAVPTVIRAGSGLNVVPAEGELICDLRALSLEPIEAAIASMPTESRGVRLETEALRLWPAMDTREATAGLLADAGEVLGRPIVARKRGGASDASHIATTVAQSVDGLGPRGGHAHHPDEFVLAESLRPRAEVALAVAAGALGLG